MDSSKCFDETSQLEVYGDLKGLLVDYAENQSIKTFALDLWEVVPDLSKALANCNIDAIIAPISEAFEMSGEKMFARISQEYSTITALHADMNNQISQGNFEAAGQQFGNILGLIMTPEPQMLTSVKSFEDNFGNFCRGAAIGFQPKPTPLSKCYNSTVVLGSNTHNLNTMVSQCLHFNFTACNEVPAYLTIFNANVGSIYDGCEYQVLVAKIQEVNNPTRISQIVFIYYSNEVAIKTLENQFMQAQTKGDFYTMGVSLASIIRILLGFSVNQ